MQENDAWLWSEAFAKIVDSSMQDTLSDVEVPWDWPQRRKRLEGWREQVETARDLYKQGHTETLRVLFDYWRAIADDAPQQARIAETARAHYKHGHTETLQVLFNYWRTIADDAREQARIAGETYRLFQFQASA